VYFYLWEHHLALLHGMVAEYIGRAVKAGMPAQQDHVHEKQLVRNVAWHFGVDFRPCSGLGGGMSPTHRLITQVTVPAFYLKPRPIIPFHGATSRHQTWLVAFSVCRDSGEPSRHAGHCRSNTCRSS